MLDFTSSLYLGFQHGAGSLRPWSQLTTGAPAALHEPSVAAYVARRLAWLQGCEQAVLGPSTFHLFWDLCGMLTDQGHTFYLDKGAYPIARWGVERAAGSGAVVAVFRHHNAAVLQQLLREARAGRPVIVADGICNTCGCNAPLADYLMLARRHDGLLLVDDTQALGILGVQPNHGCSYGRGGGGSMRHLGLEGPDILTISSLAKGFGAPLAVLAGSEGMIRSFTHRSETRAHCSPPSLAAVHAAARALQLNSAQGDALRNRLNERVRQFRRLLMAAGLSADSGLFPVQTLKLPPNLNTRRVHERLLVRGVRTVLRRGCGKRGPALSFVINARHQPAEIVEAVRELATAIKLQRRLQFE